MLPSTQLGNSIAYEVSMKFRDDKWFSSHYSNLPIPMHTIYRAEHSGKASLGVGLQMMLHVFVSGRPKVFHAECLKANASDLNIF